MDARPTGRVLFTKASGNLDPYGYSAVPYQPGGVSFDLIASPFPIEESAGEKM